MTKSSIKSFMKLCEENVDSGPDSPLAGRSVKMNVYSLSDALMVRLSLESDHYQVFCDGKRRWPPFKRVWKELQPEPPKSELPIPEGLPGLIDAFWEELEEKKKQSQQSQDRCDP
jgi:hypothetical protein